MKQISFRGKTYTENDVLEAMKRFDKDYRPTYRKRFATYVIKHDGKLYPPKDLLRVMTGQKVIPGGGKPVNTKFEALGFPVTMVDDTEPLDNGPETAEEDAEETVLSLESDLEDSLVAKLDQLEPGLRLYSENGHSGEQFHAPPAGRIDLLCTDSKGDLVVIELKAGEADRDVCGQVQAYMGWVKEKLASDRAVKGIIVASDFTERMKLAAKVVPNLSLKKYHINFSFSDA
jgi:hypothetical protein